MRELSVTVRAKNNKEVEFVFIDNESGDVSSTIIWPNGIIARSRLEEQIGQELLPWAEIELDEYEYRKRDWIDSHINLDMAGLDDDAVNFYYYACHDNNMHLADADRYAMLCTLFGYDIGVEHAKAIDNWCYENGMDILDFDYQDIGTIMNICDFELGFRLNSYNAIGHKVEAYDFTPWK